jgi:ubiquinone/menaquinone biosynthesis C-methylase UbiE
MLEHLEFETIIDVGASTGAAVKRLINEGKNAMGIEPSLEAVNIADTYGRPILWGEANRIPFPNKHVDIVMSTDVFEHLEREDIDGAIAECFRVARKYIAMKIASFSESGGWGELVGVADLHLTQEPIEWWMERFLSHGGKTKYYFEDTFVLDIQEK